MGDLASTLILGSSLGHLLQQDDKKDNHGLMDNASQKGGLKDKYDKKEKDFSYSPINGAANEVRLVTLHRARQDDEPIRCSLQNVALLNATNFEALSYRWGDPKQTRPIRLDEASFEITNNLYDALLNLRQPDQDRTIWIDAICINQKDASEREIQVGLMHDVYRQARQVIIWIGTYSEPEDHQITLFKNLSVEMDLSNFIPQAFVLIEDLGRWYRTVWSTYNTKLPQIPIMSGQNIHTWIALFVLFNRSWFTRLWVFQELRLARNSPNSTDPEDREAVVVCGRCSVSWLNFFAASMVVVRPFQPPHKFLEGSPGRWHADLCVPADRVYYFSFSQEGYNLMKLLYRTKDLVCADPRDKLLALLGVAPLEDQKDMNVGYSQNVEQSYTQWAQRRIERSKRLDIMTLCVDTVTKGLPSWVPDLRTCFHEYDGDLFPQNTRNGLRGSFAASGNILASWNFSADSKMISVMGYEIDSIMAISQPHPPGRKDAIQVQEWLRRWEDIVANSLGTHSPLNLETYRKFSNVVFCGGKEGNTAHSPSFHEQLIAWRRRQVQNEPGKSSAVDQGFSDRLIGSLYFRLQNMQILVTSAGVLGVVSANCHISKGDRVCVIHGGDVPFILRRIGSDENHLDDYPGPKEILQEGYSLKEDQIVEFSGKRPHRLMGPCYLYGAMDGEIVSRWRRDEIEFKVLTLC